MAWEGAWGASITAGGSPGACFLFVAARRGSETAYGVLLVALVHEFGWERATITGAFSLAMLVAGVPEPIGRAVP
jgi:hypothetical protein